MYRRPVVEQPRISNHPKISGLRAKALRPLASEPDSKGSLAVHPHCRASGSSASLSVSHHGCPASERRPRRRSRVPLSAQHLAGRPMHVATAKHVEMQVINGLAAIVARVDDDAIAVLKSGLAGNLRRDGEQMP
jgi:hypothetical protein